MDYTTATDAVTDAITSLGTNALAVMGALIVLAGSVFLITWGFKKAKKGMSGKV